MFWALFYTWIILKIVRRDQNLTIIEQAKKASPVWGNILGSIMVLFFILVAFTYLYDLADFLNILLPKTPTVVFSLLVIGLVAYVVKLGLEVLSRTAVLLIVPVLFLVAVGIVPNVFTINFPLILMPLENWRHTVRGVLFQASVFGELLVLTMLVPATTRSPHTGKYVLTAIVFGWLITLALIFTLYGNFSTYTTQIIYKLFELYRDIGRIESLFLFLWVSTFFIKVSIFLYAAVRGLSDIMGLKDYKPLVFPLAMLIAFLPLVTFSDYIDFFEFYTNYYPLAALAVQLGIPLLFLTAIVIKPGPGT